MRHGIAQACITIALFGCAANDQEGARGAAPTESSAVAAQTDEQANGSRTKLVQPAPSEGKVASEFAPPLVPDGFMRLEAATIKDIKPGSDITICQYVMGPVDHDMNVLAVQGAQSAFGHHIVAFSYTASGDEELHSSFNCGATEFTAGDAAKSDASQGHVKGQGGFLGSSATGVPDGVAYRLKQGDGIMLNAHFINVSEETIDGKAYLDVKLAEVDPSQKLASLFTAINAGFNIDAHATASSSVECVVQSDLQILMLSNHMHEYGRSARTEVVRAGSGEVKVLHEDNTWTPEMQFNADFTKWTVDQPFVVHAGDTLRTSCSWTNTTDFSLSFPREMCVSAGFVLTTGDNPTAPGTCANGRWNSRK